MATCSLGYELSTLKQDQNTEAKYLNVVPITNGYIGAACGQNAYGTKQFDALWGFWSPFIHLTYGSRKDIGTWEQPSRVFIKKADYSVVQQKEVSDFMASWLKKSGVYYVKWTIESTFQVEEYIFCPINKKALVVYVILKNISDTIQNPVKIQFLAECYLDGIAEGVKIYHDQTNGVLIAEHTANPEAHYVLGLSSETIGDWQCGIKDKVNPPNKSAYLDLTSGEATLSQDNSVTAGANEVADCAISTNDHSIAPGEALKTAIVVAIGGTQNEALTAFNEVVNDDPEDLIRAAVTWWRNWRDEGDKPRFRNTVWNDWVDQALICMKMHVDSNGGCYADWTNYPEVFPRDALPAAWAFASWGHQAEAEAICNWLKEAYEVSGFQNQYRSDKSVGKNTFDVYDNYPRYVYVPFMIYRVIGNETFLTGLWDLIRAAISTMIDELTQDNLVPFKGGDDIWAYWPTPPATNSYFLEHQINYYHAFKFGALIAERLGHTNEAALWGNYAENIKLAIIDLLRTPSRYGYYYDPATAQLNKLLTPALQSLLYTLPFNQFDDHVLNSMSEMENNEILLNLFMTRFQNDDQSFAPHIGRYLTSKRMIGKDITQHMEALVKKLARMGQLAESYRGTDEMGDPLGTLGSRMLTWANAEALIALNTRPSSLLSTERSVKQMVVSLLQGVHVYDDNGAPVPGVVSGAWYDKDLFQDYDWQISVGPLIDEYHRVMDLGAANRELISSISINVWVMQKRGINYTPERLRGSLIDEVDRLISLQGLIAPTEGIEYALASGWMDRDEPKNRILRSECTVQVWRHKTWI